jgi:hypothetical protein
MNPTLSYNCGIIGFNNQELKDKYLHHYMEALKKVPKVEGTQWWYSPDLVFEQKHLYEMVNHYGYKVRALFGKQVLKEDEYNLPLPAKQFYEHVVSV